MLSRTHLAFAGMVLVLALSPSQAQDLQIFNPNWNITLTDSGYADLLFDNTPGSVGREYLSGEWGAAVSYKVGATTVTPKWLEPEFLFPDWTTNSNFTVVNPISATAFNADLTPKAAASTISNGDLRIDMTYEMQDTVVGMKMGTSPASAGSGSSFDSNRHVMKQTYTVTNTSGQSITDLNLFQFLHGLNSESSLYDNRNYGGPLGAYQYDTTQQGMDGAFHDYLNFGSTQVPVAFDNGRYGIDDGGPDDHDFGKPSVGVHYSIENDALTNDDYFAPPELWVGGAQKYTLGGLANGGSVSFDVVLSVRTATSVQDTGPADGSANGGAFYAGGVDYSFDDVTTPGDFFAEYDSVDAAELAFRVGAGEFSTPDFTIPGDFQLFELEFSGEFDDTITIVLAYDESLLPLGYDETLLDIYHYSGGVWQALGGVVDPFANTITGQTDHLSPFGIGAVPEPTSTLLFALLSVLAMRRRGCVST